MDNWAYKGLFIIIISIIIIIVKNKHIFSFGSLKVRNDFNNLSSSYVFYVKDRFAFINGFKIYILFTYKINS